MSDVEGTAQAGLEPPELLKKVAQEVNDYYGDHQSVIARLKETKAAPMMGDPSDVSMGELSAIVDRAESNVRKMANRLGIQKRYRMTGQVRERVFTEEEAKRIIEFIKMRY